MVRGGGTEVTVSTSTKPEPCMKPEVAQYEERHNEDSRTVIYTNKIHAEKT